MGEIQLIYANTIDEAISARDSGFEPVECAFGKESVVGPLVLDHHGKYSAEPAVSIKAAHLANDGISLDKFVITGRADCDLCYAIAVLSRQIPVDFTDAEAVAELDIDPIGRDRTSSRYIEALMFEQQTSQLPKDLEGSRTAISQLVRIFNGYYPISFKETRRIEGQRIASIGSHLLDFQNGVGFAVSDEKGFDVWYQRAPVIVHYNPGTKSITFGLCPKKGGTLTDKTGFDILGSNGLSDYYSRVDEVLGVKGSGGRDVVGGSPRGEEISQENARKVYEFLKDSVV